jgi:hypothetical protein
VNPPGGQIQPVPGSTQITLTAQGGTVDWSTTVSAGQGYISVDPSSGTLAAGQTVTVTIQASHGAVGLQVTISPGGAVFTIADGNGNSLAAEKGRSPWPGSWWESGRLTSDLTSHG